LVGRSFRTRRFSYRGVRHWTCVNRADGVGLNWNSGERQQPASVFWRKEGRKTDGCHLLKVQITGGRI
jgi:hypothetical protein